MLLQTLWMEVPTYVSSHLGKNDHAQSCLGIKNVLYKYHNNWMHSANSKNKIRKWSIHCRIFLNFKKTWTGRVMFSKIILIWLPIKHQELQCKPALYPILDPIVGLITVATKIELYCNNYYIPYIPGYLISLLLEKKKDFSFPFF